MLLENINKIHTTPLGLIRLKKNIGIDDINYYLNIIKSSNSIIKKGKNWYVEDKDIIITINSYNYTIITAHRRMYE